MPNDRINLFASLTETPKCGAHYAGRYMQNQIMNIYLSIIIVFIGIPLLGFGMFKAARWSRKRNEELKVKHADSQEQALKNMFQGKKGSFADFYTSSISKPEAFIGKVLAVGVILFFVILALLLAYYGWTRI